MNTAEAKLHQVTIGWNHEEFQHVDKAVTPKMQIDAEDTTREAEKKTSVTASKGSFKSLSCGVRLVLSDLVFLLQDALSVTSESPCLIHVDCGSRLCLGFLRCDNPVIRLAASQPTLVIVTFDIFFSFFENELCMRPVLLCSVTDVTRLLALQPHLRLFAA